jgi:hypothetical protein
MRRHLEERLAYETGNSKQGDSAEQTPEKSDLKPLGINHLEEKTDARKWLMSASVK